MVLKTTKEARENFEAALPFIPERYEKGARKADWYTPAKSPEAEANYKAVMTKVLAEERRRKRIEALSNTVWLTGLIEKGKPIIEDRIRKALGKWESKWGPMYAEITKLVPTLPRKSVDFMKNISERLVPTVKKWKEVSGKL